MQNFIEKIEFTNNEAESQKLASSCFSPSTSDNDINLDSEDFEQLLERGKYAEIFVSEATGKRASLKAMHEIIDSIGSLDSMSGIVLRFHINPNVSILTLNDALQLFGLYQQDEIKATIWTTQTDDALDIEYVKISAIVTYKEKQ
jgi:cell division GTPase FtsZ